MRPSAGWRICPRSPSRRSTATPWAAAARSPWPATSASPRRTRRFGQPECGLGILPGFGGTQRLARLVGKGRAKELIFTCDRIDAQEAYRIGLANKVVPQAELLDACRAMAQRILKNGGYAVTLAKQAINAGTGHGPCQRPEDGGGRLWPCLFHPRQEGGHDGLPGKASRGADGFLRPCSPGDPQRGRTLAARFPAQEKPGTQLCAGLLV